VPARPWGRGAARPARVEDLRVTPRQARTGPERPAGAARTARRPPRRRRHRELRGPRDRHVGRTPADQPGGRGPARPDPPRPRVVVRSTSRTSAATPNPTTPCLPSRAGSAGTWSGSPGITSRLWSARRCSGAWWGAQGPSSRRQGPNASRSGRATTRRRPGRVAGRCGRRAGPRTTCGPPSSTAMPCEMREGAERVAQVGARVPQANRPDVRTIMRPRRHAANSPGGMADSLARGSDVRRNMPDEWPDVPSASRVGSIEVSNRRGVSTVIPRR
jgi:hypothetical protein